MSAANDTRGHSAANPGLRGHSCGDNYPLTITGSPTGWRVFHCKTGVESIPFSTYQEAFAFLGVAGNCPVCGTKNSANTVSKHGSLVFHRCKQCGKEYWR